MSSYIETAKANIRKISEKLHAMEAKNMRYGLVCYRDHPPQDSSYATKVFPLTKSIREMQNNVDTMTAAGGGDGPESVACALEAALNADWRKNAVKVCVIIADAPPHGLGNDGDGFPNGCPCGFDPLQTARKMAENNIVIYAVAVEPNLGNYKNGRAFYKGIAQITHGRFLDLGRAHLLPDVIIGGSAEELDLKKIEEEIEKEYTKAKTEAPTLATDALEEVVHKNLAAKGVSTWHLEVTEQDAMIENESIFYAADSLETAKTSLAHKPSALVYDSVSHTAPAPASTGFSLPSFLSNIFGSSSPSTTTTTASPTYASTTDDFMSAPAPAHRNYEHQEAKVYKDTVSKSQVSKVMKKNNYM